MKLTARTEGISTGPSSKPQPTKIFAESSRKRKRLDEDVKSIDGLQKTSKKSQKSLRSVKKPQITSNKRQRLEEDLDLGKSSELSSKKRKRHVEDPNPMAISHIVETSEPVLSRKKHKKVERKQIQVPLVAEAKHSQICSDQRHQVESAFGSSKYPQPISTKRMQNLGASNPMAISRIVEPEEETSPRKKHKTMEKKQPQAPLVVKARVRKPAADAAPQDQGTIPQILAANGEPGKSTGLTTRQQERVKDTKKSQSGKGQIQKSAAQAPLRRSKRLMGIDAEEKEEEKVLKPKSAGVKKTTGTAKKANKPTAKDAKKVTENGIEKGTKKETKKETKGKDNVGMDHLVECLDNWK